MGSHSLLQGDLLNPRIKPRSPVLHTDSLLSELPGKPIKLLTKWEMSIEAAWALLITQAYPHSKTLILHSPGVDLNDPDAITLGKADHISVRSTETSWRGK